MADDPLHVLLDSTVRKRLEKTLRNPKKELLGYLYGGVVSNNVHIIGCVACTNLHPPSKNGLPGIPDWKTEFTELSALMPKGIQLCGIYYPCQKATQLKEHYLDKVVNGFCFEENLAANGKFLCLQICINDGDGIYKCFSYDRKAGSLSECEFQVADICDEFLQSRISFRIQANIQISTEVNQNSFSDIAWKIERSCQKLGSASTVFYLKDCNVLLRKENSELPVSSNAENCDTLLSSAGLPQERNNLTGIAKNRARQKGGRAVSSTGSKPKKQDFLEVRVLHQITETGNNQGAIVPVIQHKKVPRTCVILNFPVEALLNLPRSVLIQKLPQLFSSAICCQLRKMASVMSRFSKDGVFSVPKVYHFKLPGFCHLVTAVYPSNMSKDSLVDNEELTLYRLDLHKQLLLPQNQPLMRPSNAFVFGSEQQGLYLTNPHEGIAGGSCGSVAVVDGTYTYHHYMQDNFNDDGWGCAYRSLQTIVSWFHYQGYTSKPVPSHREIQQALVDLQDKGKEFVGSRQWIGSFEVSMCLEYLLGITSKILFVSSGADMLSKGRDLLHHFQTQGTPIMIGGGVLAHTILGVDFNDQTGDVRFLILDPHYTGGEDMKFILDKGWCGWKGPDFWNKQAHYNMCLPQRPDMI